MTNNHTPIEMLDRKIIVLAIGLLVLLGILLRIPNLNESLWFDEVMYSTHIGTPTRQALWNFLLFEPPAPLYTVFMFFWSRLAGENYDVIIRLPSLLCGILSIIIAVLFANKLYGPRAALLAGLLLCLSPVHVWYSQEATPYAMANFLLLAAIFSFFLLRENPDRCWFFAAYTLFLLGAIFTHYMTAAFLLPLSLAGLTSRSLRKRLFLIHLGILICLIFALVLKSQLGNVRTGMGFLRAFTPFQWWMLFFNWFLHGNSIWTSNPYQTGPSFLLEHPFLIMVQLYSLAVLVRGLIIAGKKQKSIQNWEIVLYLTTLPLLLFCLTLFGYNKLYIERYLFSILPLFFIVLAGGAAGWLKGRQAALVMAPLVALGIISYIFFIQKSETWTVYKQNADWRSTADYFANEPDKSPVIYVASPAKGLEFYLNMMETDKNFQIRDFDEAFLEMDITKDRIETLYLVKNNFWSNNFESTLNKVSQGRRLALDSIKSFKGIDIYKFSIQPTSSIKHTQPGRLRFLSRVNSLQHKNDLM